MTFTCPFCRKAMTVPQKGADRLYRHGSRINIKTNCCGKVVAVQSLTDYEVYPTARKEDDWGEHVSSKPVPND
jgi:hypothetical protein